MATTVIKGNAVSAFLAGEIDVLIHCANCQAIMGSGIAREIAARVPGAKLTDDEYYNFFKTSNQSLLGRASFYMPNDSSVLINLYGQEFPGYPQPRPMNYGALGNALSYARSIVLTQIGQPTKIGLPYKMASDRAGGDWKIVLEMVEWYFRYYEIVVYDIEGKSL